MDDDNSLSSLKKNKSYLMLTWVLFEAHCAVGESNYINRIAERTK